MVDGAVGLHGRGPEIERLEALIHAATRGDPCVAVVEGEPGIDKTRLLDEVVALASACQLAVLRASARELERDRPFGAMADALGLHAGAKDPARAALGAALVGGRTTTTGDAEDGTAR